MVRKRSLSGKSVSTPNDPKPKNKKKGKKNKSEGKGKSIEEELGYSDRVAKRIDKVATTVKQRKKLFLDTYVKLNCNIGATCKVMGMTRRTFNNWKNDDEEFLDSCKEVELAYIDNLIALHDKFCLEKKDTKQLWKKIQAKSDDEDYRRATKKEVTGKDGQPLLGKVKEEFSDEALKSAVKNILLEEE